MLTSTDSGALATGAGRRFVVVASRYNARFVDGMLEAAVTTFQAAGAPTVEVFRVPGAWEIPVAAAAVVRRPGVRPDAVVCLGLILQGETSHARHIGDSVSDALMRLSVKQGVPIIHEVLTVSTEAQAEARCLDPRTNRGAEAARTALDMAALMDRVAG